ncbi:MAG: GIY-YIG nuclease family protein [Deltaproteobacteria bacterium]|nr:GIY-YIG nuclease family protein [Deltaproteobacteria bacterium]
MAIKLNTILTEAGLNVAEVRLLRHKDNKASKGRTPYELWRDSPEQFDLYQSVQGFHNREKMKAKYWASFVVSSADETVFVGLYRIKDRGISDHDIPKPHSDGVDPAGTVDIYDLEFQDVLSDLKGKLIIDWGSGERAWVQRPDRQNKDVLELRAEFKEPEFPGFLNFIEQLSKLERLPKGWIAALRSTKGVYLLTCPRTKEQYVGSASGEEGFWQRWEGYVQNRHGGNIALKSRDPSDYQVSILEVAGTASTAEDIIAMETRWKRKLQSREMGLNRN